MKQFFVAFCLLTSTFLVYSQQKKTIELPIAVKTGGMPLREALNKRQSNREYTGNIMDWQTLSNLLWSANGFNRPDKRTIATSENRQEMDVYVVMKDEVYLYDAYQHKLKLQVKDDVREALGQPTISINAALTLVYVADMKKASNREAAFIDTGHICQNVYLFCASYGLGTVARTSFRRPDLHNALKLSENQEITLVQSVGYLK